MKFFYNLERKYGRYAIPDLMKYICALYAAGIVVQLFMPGVYYSFLCLDAQAILHGQIWRIVTFMIWPPVTVSSVTGGTAAMMNSTVNILFSVILLYCYRNLGAMLERVWGAFRFNVYMFLGILGHVAAVIIIYLIWGGRYILTTDYLNFSLFFAIAFTFPDLRFYLFYVIPIKAKWLILFDGLFFAYGFVFGGAVTRVAIVMSLANVLWFLAMTGGAKYNPKEIRRKHDFRQKANEAAKAAKTVGRHRCVVCGRTDLDDPNLTFRFCSKCSGDYEYCQDHLYTHRHVTAGGMDPRQAGQN